MTVGTGVGRWRFIFWALWCLMAKPATEVIFPAKSRSSTKLHWCIIIARVGYINRNGYRSFTLALFVNDASLCEPRTDLLSHLHSWLQINGPLRTNPGLNITLQTIEKTKQGLSLIDVNTLSMPFGKPYDIVCNRPSLGPFCQCLPRLEGIICWLEVIQQRHLQVRPSQHITLHLVPSVGVALQQPNCNLATFHIICKVH